MTNLAGSMGVVVTNQFGASKALSQLGTLANFIAYACMGIPGGIILKRYGYKFTSRLAVIVGLVGVAIQFASGYVESFGVYVAGAFVAGFSMCLLNICVNPMLNSLGGGGNKGNQLVQFGGACNSIGGTITPALVGWLVGGSITVTTVAKTAPVMIISLTEIPEPHMETAEEKAARKSGAKTKDQHSPLSFRHFVLGAIAIFFYVGIEVGIPNTANVYYSGVEGIGPALAGSFVAAYWFSMLIGRLVGGAIGAKVSSKKMLVSTASVAILFLLGVIFLPQTLVIKGIPVALFLIVACGLCTSVMWGSIFNLAAEGLGKYTAAASGIFMALVCGGGIIPFVQNLIADKVGSIPSYALLVVCLLYLVYYALRGSKNVNKDIPVE